MFCTGHCDPVVVETINSLPGTHWVRKTENHDELLTVVMVLLGDSRAAPLARPTPTVTAVADVRSANAELLSHLGRHPEGLHSFTPRQFEELIARIFADIGYDVELTQQTRDGGFDIRAIRRDDAGPVLYLVECKRFRPDNPVGVGLVRQLYAVKQLARANVAVLATTSFFTQPAHEFQRPVGFELSLRDYSDICGWLAKYG